MSVGQVVRATIEMVCLVVFSAIKQVTTYPSNQHEAIFPFVNLVNFGKDTV